MSKLSTPIPETVLVVDTNSFAGLGRIQPHATGMDIGAHEIWVCIPGDDIPKSYDCLEPTRQIYTRLVHGSKNT